MFQNIITFGKILLASSKTVVFNKTLSMQWDVEEHLVK